MKYFDYQLRVIEERDELKKKLDSLNVFINENPNFDKLNKKDGYMLVHQEWVMQAYFDVLNHRISEFVGEENGAN